MFKNWSYKKRFIYLQIAIVLLLVISYQLSVKKTFELKKDLTTIDMQLLEIGGASEEMRNLKMKLHILDKSVSNKYNKDRSIQEVLMEKIVTYCNANSILINEFPKSQVVNKDNYTLETNHLVLQGDFHKLLTLVYSVEQKFKLGKASSMRFYKKINSKTKNSDLFLEMYIQNIMTHEK